MNTRSGDVDELRFKAGTTRRRILTGLGAIAGGLLALRGATGPHAAEASVGDKFAQRLPVRTVDDEVDETE